MVFHHFNSYLDETPNYHLPLPPALIQHDASAILTDKLTALREGRETFILGESSERIRRALSNNVWTSGDTKYITRESVYFKKINEKRRRGPGKVLSQDGQQVLVKYGSNYVRVHPCRLSLARNAYNNLNPNAVQKLTGPSQIRDKNNSHIILESKSEDETIQQNNSYNDSTIKNKEETIQQNINTIPENSLKEIDNLSASLKKLSVSHQEPELPKPPTLKENTKVQFQFKDSNEWRIAVLISRSGKATGKYSKEWNSKLDDDSICPKDFERDVDNLHIMSNSSVNTLPSTEEIQYSKIYMTAIENQANIAKMNELESSKKHEVYCKEEDTGQSCISVRWVLSHEIKNRENVTKARLCARGFEIKDFPTDSPCCSQLGVQSVFVLIAWNKWKVQAIEFKAAFLQGKQIKRTVYLRPPKEANTNKMWKLQKCVYGLADACRYWYLRVKEELIKLGANVSSVDPGLFYWKKHYKLVGILAGHYDDMIWGGIENFKINVIDNLKNTFMFGTEETKAFTYLGIQLIQNNDFSLTINQNNYVDCISEIKLSNGRLIEKNTYCSMKKKHIEVFQDN